ncbi:MAG: GNAT family N-acetyltransferase [Phycisphaerales bacterium]|nr:GNAT family N-acetyltransferase [Phycisphaerales bacterium]
MPDVIHAQHIPKELWLSAAERLVSSPGEKEAAKRLVANAQGHKINLNLLRGALGTTPNGTPFVRQTCLAVIGSGKTAMLFMSAPKAAPKDTNRFGDDETQRLEIAAALRAALDQLPALAPGQVTLAQTLLEPAHRWASKVCLQAGMIFVGRLEYLRRELLASDVQLPVSAWPNDVTVRPIGDVLDFSADGDGTKLAAALDASYEDTLDCPELCGMRSTQNVIESHRAADAFDPNHWYLVEHHHAPVGCCLLTHTPDHESVELVYIGLGRSVRGLGLGRNLLTHAIVNLGVHNAKELTCAVDTRNIPALNVYSEMGFSSFDARLGYIAQV